MVCLLDLAADFGVKTNADLTPISQLDQPYRHSCFSRHQYTRKTQKGEEGEIAVHSNPNWTMTQTFCVQFPDGHSRIHFL